MWLWEALNELEAAEAAQTKPDDPGVKQTRPREKTTGDQVYQTLSYEEFMAGRQLRSAAPESAQSSLAGSELSHVRFFLNRILTIGDDAPPAAEVAVTEGLDLGDETPDPAHDLEQGEDFGKPPRPTPEPEKEEEVRRRRAAQARANRDQIVQAVEKFNERLKARTQAGSITTFDVLRLRAMLMIIAAAGQPPTASAKLTSLQVLPRGSDEGWPRLMGRLLFAFFGGNRPAIQHLQIEPIHESLPKDVLECWATALWAVQACLQAVTLHPDTKDAVRYLTPLAEQVRARAKLSPEELGSEHVTRILEELERRFAVRLGTGTCKVQEQLQEQSVSARV